MADDKLAFDLKNDPTFRQMMTVITTLGTSLQEIKSTQNSLLQTLATRKEEPARKEEVSPSDEDINSMTQADLLKHITKVVGETVAKTSDSIRREVGTFSEKMTERVTREEVEKFAQTHPDLFDMTNQIKKVIDETPGISISRAYNLARSENPELTKELDEKYYKQSEDKDNPKPKPFGGLTPTSGTTLGEDGKPVKMTPEDAASKAWEETLSEFPLLANNE